MESSTDESGYLDLVVKKNSGSDRPAGSGDQGNRNPRDVILMEIDRPCADDVGKMDLSDLRDTSLSPKVPEKSKEDWQPSGKNAKGEGGNPEFFTLPGF
jgi:hypothetical protein